MSKRLVCPKGCTGQFHVTAHVTETWAVDSKGDFADIVKTDDETIVARPNLDGNFLFTCAECDTEAKIVEAKDD